MLMWFGGIVDGVCFGYLISISVVLGSGESLILLSLFLFLMW